MSCTERGCTGTILGLLPVGSKVSLSMACSIADAFDKPCVAPTRDLQEWAATNVGVLKQPGFWNFKERPDEISVKGNPLRTSASAIDFERFRPILERPAKRFRSAKHGRPVTDAILKFFYCRASKGRRSTRLKQWCAISRAGCACAVPRGATRFWTRTRSGIFARR